MARINLDVHHSATRSSHPDAFCEKDFYLFGFVYILFHVDRNKEYIHSVYNSCSWINETLNKSTPYKRLNNKRKLKIEIRSKERSREV